MKIYIKLIYVLIIKILVERYVILYDFEVELFIYICIFLNNICGVIVNNVFFFLIKKKVFKCIWKMFSMEYFLILLLENVY